MVRKRKPIKVNIFRRAVEGAGPYMRVLLVRETIIFRFLRSIVTWRVREVTNTDEDRASLSAATRC